VALFLFFSPKKRTSPSSIVPQRKTGFYQEQGRRLGYNARKECSFGKSYWKLLLQIRKTGAKNLAPVL
jgi:hypothetical protein